MCNENITMNRLFFVILLSVVAIATFAQDINSINEEGVITRRDRNSSEKDSLNNKHKEIPKGFTTWTIDQRFGDRTMVVPDTVSYLFMNTGLTTGITREHNFLGNLGSPRYNRIYADRKHDEVFLFTNVFDYFIKDPEDFHFINTLSPITNLSFNTCGDRTNGEDHLKALFAVNANKRLGVGFVFDYLYGRGYYQNQSTSLFDYTLFGSYIGSRYQAHFIASLNHQKQAENGGITNDNYITHPETFNEDYRENEIPTVLTENWNRNDNQHILFTHRYSFGFQREVPMTEAEIEARKFAIESKKEEAKRQLEQDNKEEGFSSGGNEIQDLDDIADIDHPEKWTKKEHVPVTSIIHTLNFNNYRRIYQAYQTPENFYANEYYNKGKFTGDSIYDKTRHFSLQNTLAIALLEGFNRWAKAGIKVFATHSLEHFALPNLEARMETFNENTIFLGANISKQEGKHIHYDLNASFGALGSESGNINLDAHAEFNIPLFGKNLTSTLEGFFDREIPTFYYSRFQSRHAWWNYENLNHIIKNGLSLKMAYDLTGTEIRLGLNNVKNYTYFTTNYDISEDYNISNMQVDVAQKSGNINVITLGLRQDFNIKPLHINLAATFQQTSDEDVLPLPKLDLWANLFLRFRIAKVLKCDFGADLRYFTSYYAPEYVPYIGQFAINTNSSNKTKIGNYPFVNVYANFQLKHTRFFVMLEHATSGMGNKQYFLTPHYPTNGRILRFGLSWNFYN